MSLKHHFFFLSAKRKGVSEITAAIIVFAVTLAISSIAINFLSQKASLASNIVNEESRKVIFECLAMVKIVGMKRNGNETFLVLYNPSDLTICIAAVVVGDAIQQVEAVLEPLNMTEVPIKLFEEVDVDRVRLLTVEGVLIDAKP